MLKEWLEKRESLKRQMSEIVKLAESEKRGLSSEERGKFDSLKNEIGVIDAKIETESLGTKTVEDGAGGTTPNTLPPAATASGDSAGAYDKEFRAFARKLIENRGRLPIPAEFRVLDTGSGILLPTLTANEILTQAVSVNFLRALAQSYKFKNNANVPVRPLVQEAQIIAEGGDYPTGEDAITNVLFQAFKMGNTYQMTEEQVRDSAGDIISDFTRAAGLSLGKAELRLFLTGTGTGQPQGIFTGGTTAITTASPTALTYDELVDFNASLDPVYDDGAVFIMHTSMGAVLRKIKDSNARPLWDPNYGSMAGGLPTLFGRPVKLTTYAPAYAAGNKLIALANLKYGYGIADREDTQIRILEELYAGKGLIGIRYHQRVDARILMGAAIQILVNHA